MNNNFFDKFYIPYLEYSVLTGFGKKQQEQEILDLNISEGDIIANIGINWGESLQLIFEQNPDIKHVYGIDNSKIMINLSKAIFSENDEKIKIWFKSLSPAAVSFLKTLHDESRQNNQKTTFIYSSAENLDKEKIRVDKIAATMGFHWLTNPQKAFNSMNKSLNQGGEVTFSTASARFEINNPEQSFTQNPYYTAFFENFEMIYNALKNEKNLPKKIQIKKHSLDNIIEIIENSGFKLKKHREYKFEVEADIIDEVCKAGIKFSYNLDATNPQIKQVVEQAFNETKASQDYNNSTSKYEICPIFTIKKVKNIN